MERRSTVYSFPHQVASIKDAMAQFVEEAFRPNSFEQTIMLRGAYFVSGTQVGTPIDRVLAAMKGASESIVSRTRPEPAQAQLLPEPAAARGGVRRSGPCRCRPADRAPPAPYRLEPPWRDRRPVRRGRGVGGNKLYAQPDAGHEGRSGGERVCAKAREMRLDQVDDADLARVCPCSTSCATSDRLRGTRPSTFVAGRFGLDQTEKLNSQTVSAYRRILGFVLLPRLILRLEDSSASGATIRSSFTRH